MSSPRSARAAACTSPSGLVASSVVIVPVLEQQSWGESGQEAGERVKSSRALVLLALQEV